jgi:hypothetical protein
LSHRLWRNPTIRLKDGSPAAGNRILMDGQQRVTAPIATLLAREVLTKDQETVTEIFIRVNCASASFSQADFVMSANSCPTGCSAV